jgi:hypothetical protein
MPIRLQDRLEEMRVLTGSQSLVAVIRDSLAVYERLLESWSAGAIVVVRGTDGKEREVVLCSGALAAAEANLVPKTPKTVQPD